MEELQARHRKELRDLQSQITQKKKSASKKTRKGVNEECTTLERELKERQEQELGGIDGPANGVNEGKLDPNGNQAADDDLLASIASAVFLEQKDPNSSPNTQSADLPTPTSTDTTTATKKPNRTKARLAKRAADAEAAVAQANAEASSLPDLKQHERTRMLSEFKKRGLVEKVVAANGHCMYSAVADQMRSLGLGLDNEDEDDGHVHGDVHDIGIGSTASKSNGHTENTGELRKNDYKSVRRRAASFISSHPDDFTPFLEELLEDYVHKISDTAEWGGQLELLALAKTYNLKIHVLQGDGRVEEIGSGSDMTRGEVWLAYYRHGFGLGEHYNSLRKVDSAAVGEGDGEG